MTNESFKFDQVNRKIIEHIMLSNRVNRYWKRLVKESLKIASDRGLDIIATETDIYPAYDIIIKKKGDQIVDSSQLLALARMEYPSLYRRYNAGKQKLDSITDELKQIRESLS